MKKELLSSEVATLVTFRIWYGALVNPDCIQIQTSLLQRQATLFVSPYQGMVYSLPAYCRVSAFQFF